MSEFRVMKEVAAAAQAFQFEAHDIFAVYESSPSRIIKLDEAYCELDDLSVRQDELLRQALRCVENGLYRAAHVMAWAAMMDFIEEIIEKKGIILLKRVREKWSGDTIDDIRENYPEYQIIEAGKDMGLYMKTMKKALLGLLNKRNECAHPSAYFPNLNETLGYLSEIMSRIEAISARAT